jgi:hypothetical protein
VAPRVSPRVGGHLPPYAYINPPAPLAHSSHLLLSSPWLGSHVLESCPRVRGNSTCRTSTRCWISSSSLSSSAALLDWSPDDVYTPCMCNPSEALLLRCWSSSTGTNTRIEVGFCCLHQQRLCGNVPAHSVFKGMNTTATLLPFNYIDRSWEKVCRKNIVFCCEPQQVVYYTISRFTNDIYK